MILDELPAEIAPIVQPIDDWNTCRKLGLVFEAQVEQGKLMVSAIDLVKDLEQRPVARQLRHSLLEYMSSERFAPTTAGVAGVAACVVPFAHVVAATGGDRPSQQPAPGFEAERAIDGNPDTIWHTAFGTGQSVASARAGGGPRRVCTRSAD